MEYFNTLPYLIIGSSLAFLGIYILFHNRSKVNLLLTLVCFSGAFWLLCSGLANFFSGAERVGFLLRIGHIGFILIPVLLYHFVAVFFNLKKADKYIALFYMAGLGFIILLLFSPLFFLPGYTVFFWGHTPIAGIGHLVFVAVSLAFYLKINYTLYQQYREAKKVSPLKYSQSRYLFCTFGLLPLGLLDAFSFYKIEFYPSGFVYIFLGVLLIAIIVLRYRFVEIDILVSKMVFFFIAGVILSGFFLILRGLLALFMPPSVANVLAFGVLLLILFSTSLRDTLQHSIDVLVCHNTYEYQKALKETTQLLITKLDLNELCSFLIEMLAKNIGMLKCCLFLCNEEGNYYVKAGYALETGLVNSYTISKDAPLLNWLNENRCIFIREEMTQVMPGYIYKSVYGDLFRVNAEVIIPLFYRGNLSGFITLDNKSSGTIYNQADIDILETMAAQAAIAIEKAKLYTEAVTDSLTQLYYYRYFQRRLEEEMDRARRYSHHLALILIAIDGLQEINRLYGYEEDERIIREIAQSIRKNIRMTDMASRFSSQEFIIFLPEAREEAAYTVAQRIKENALQVFLIAERIRQEMEKQNIRVVQEQKVGITISAGISSFHGTEGFLDTGKLIIMAREALNIAKERGGNRVQYYNHDFSSLENRTS